MSPFKPSDLHLIPQVITFENQLLPALDYFTISLHSPKGRHLGLCKGTVSDLWKMVDIPTNHMSLQTIVTDAFPAYI